MHEIINVLQMAAAGNTDPDQLATVARQVLAGLKREAVPFDGTVEIRPTVAVPNSYTIYRNDGQRLIWLGRLQLNGELLVERQLQMVRQLRDVWGMNRELEGMP